MKTQKESREVYLSYSLMDRINLKASVGLSLITILWQHKDVVKSRFNKLFT